MSNQSIVVPAGTPPVRLDVFLTQHTDLSRSQLQKHIKSGAVLLNGRAVSAHHQVHPGDAVVLQEISATYHEQPITADTADPVVVFEDDNLLVINKPSGLVVHPAPGIRERTVYDWAVQHAPAIGGIGDQPQLRGGIVHRLDRDVSGLMVIAKSQPMFDFLKSRFQEHAVEKEYLALVHGRLTDTSGRIDFAIARKADHSGLMVARPKSQEGKEAATLFTVERHIKNLTLVRVRTLTGRSHQIRVHFKAIGHPLVGDPLYRIRGQKRLRITPPRPFLHATVLGFTDLAGQRRKFEAPLPNDLQQYLARVG
ncbi:MAG: RluA family pseudouridine synthase [Candidatus Kerfeldbacteria bacterium]|nr:RluA family pseudouridine synthase [Candidatus Kerfeldbacteria bacterium]